VWDFLMRRGLAESVHAGVFEEVHPSHKERINTPMLTEAAAEWYAPIKQELLAFYAEIDGSKLNKLFQGQEAFTPAINGGSIDGTTVGGTTPGSGSFTTLKVTGFETNGIQSIAAAGATQGAAAKITQPFAIITVSTASARGVVLPAVATGLRVYLASACTQGTKVYPGSGAQILSSATNTAVVIAGFKANLYMGLNKTKWVLFKGA
jgi:hypothetical protein